MSSNFAGQPLSQEKLAYYRQVGVAALGAFGLTEQNMDPRLYTFLAVIVGEVRMNKADAEATHENLDTVTPDAERMRIALIKIRERAGYDPQLHTPCSLAEYVTLIASEALDTQTEPGLPERQERPNEDLDLL